MKNTSNYVITTDENGIDYILTREGGHPRLSLATIMAHDISIMEKFLSTTENINSLNYYWSVIPDTFISRDLDYFQESSLILRAFASNPHTPQHIIKEVLLTETRYGDEELGIEPDVMDMFAYHDNSDIDLIRKYVDRVEHRGIEQEDFLAAYNSLNNAMEAFQKDTELYSRIENVSPRHLEGTRYEMQFDPEDVRKIGQETFQRLFVPLFVTDYNEETGTFTGWIEHTRNEPI